MKPQDFWNTYRPDQSPQAFMLAENTDDPESAVQHFLDLRPAVFGIVRTQSWRDSFAQEIQHGTDTVHNALVAHLDATREDWEVPVTDALARAQAKKEATTAKEENRTPEKTSEENSPENQEAAPEPTTE